MNHLPNGRYEYRAGGALPAGAQTYVKRQADEELFQALLARDYCYVLNTRQMGKSSLCVRTMARLRQQDVICAAVDLSNVASTLATQEQWYEALLDQLAENLGLLDEVDNKEVFDLAEWRRVRSHLSADTRFRKFLEWVVLNGFPGKKVVIFFDEIDSMLRQSFRGDDFFITIRSCYHKGVDNPNLGRLSFALLGVANPSELIFDKTRTPFNIGRAIELCGFTLEEAEPLALGLTQQSARPKEVLRNILSWTNGQPFLTHKICKLINEARIFIPEDDEEAQVRRIVQERIINNWGVNDTPPHLKTISDRILQSPKQRTSRLLGLYQQILKDDEIAADDTPEQMELRLSGLVVNQNGRLKVYNPIYAAIFNEQWVETNFARLRPYSESLLAWYKSDCKDESRLLRGKALRDAQTWVIGKDLSNSDWRFLAASQDLERREIEHAFEAEQAAKQTMESALAAEATAKSRAEEALFNAQKATQVLETAHQEAKRKNSRARAIFLTALLAAFLLASGVAVFAYQAIGRAQSAENKARSNEEQARLADLKLKELDSDLKQKQADLNKMTGVRESLTAELTRQVTDLNTQIKREQGNARKAQDEVRRAKENADKVTKGLQDALADMTQKLNNAPKCPPN
jgi:hypothetical protein